jgi:ribosomal protein S18 acetylase RimI-like enzyme
MSDEALAWRVEEACLSAWPSPRHVFLEGWLLRVSGGVTRRINSVNPLRGESRDPQGILAPAQAIYQALGQPLIFRVPSIVKEMDPPLKRLGFTAEGETCTLLAGFEECAHTGDKEVELALEPSTEWLAAQARMTPSSDADEQIYKAVVGAIILPKAFAALRYEGRIVSLAFGVIHNSLLVLESVATEPEQRQRGFAERTVAKLMNWAHHQNAMAACLQVVADNAPAHALYRKLGFQKELYRYHYRRQPK